MKKWTGLVQTNLSPQLFKRVKAAAVADGVSMSAWVRRLIDREIGDARGHLLGELIATQRRHTSPGEERWYILNRAMRAVLELAEKEREP